MTGPRDIQVIPKIEIQLNSLAFQFIHDRAVVDAVDGYALALVFVVKPVAFFLHLRNADRLDPQHLLGDQKIGQSLLVEGIDLEKNHVFGVVITDNSATEQGCVRLVIQAAKQVFEFPVKAEDVNISLRQDCLITVQRRESLQLNKLWL